MKNGDIWLGKEGALGPKEWSCLGCRGREMKMLLCHPSPSPRLLALLRGNRGNCRM